MFVNTWAGPKGQCLKRDVAQKGDEEGELVPRARPAWQGAGSLHSTVSGSQMGADAVGAEAGAGAVEV